MKDLQKYLLQKVDYLKDFDDPEFGVFYYRHKAKVYLDAITKGILAEVWPEYTVDELNNFRGWVYKFGDTIRNRERRIIERKSAELKEVIKSKVGQKVTLVIEGYNSLGWDVQKQNQFNIIKDAEERIFLMPPRARRKGYLLDSVIIIELEGNQ
jgi:hypothetical protein